MKYDEPKLRELLAGRYILGTMPRRARSRFERLIAEDATFCREVRDWAEFFGPIDEATPPELPPARVWRGIEAKLGPAARPAAAEGWFASLWFWRGLSGFAVAVAAALLLYVGVFQNGAVRPSPAVVAVLNDQTGAPAWIATSSGKPGEVVVSALSRQTIDAQHAFQLWAIAGGPPRPLGLLSPQPGGRLVLADAVMPPTGGILAVSLEPSGGSPTGAPTGPVMFSGKVFTNPL